MEGHFLRCFLLINFIQIGFAQRLTRRDICLLEVAEGSCLDDLPRFYYNTMTQTCEEFSYGGCEGNANNFKSFEECHKTCHSIPKIPRICRFPKDEGHCFGISRRYFFNMTSMLCEEFSYGGCGGNNNNFRKQHLCMEYCSPPKAVHVICLDPLDRGTGNAAIPRYYFDSTKKTCKQFEYSGSGGNNNNFVSMESCLNICTQKNKQQKLPERRIRVLRKRT